jgi:hypothetical protein
MNAAATVIRTRMIRPPLEALGSFDLALSIHRGGGTSWLVRTSPARRPNSIVSRRHFSQAAKWASISPPATRLST